MNSDVEELGSAARSAIILSIGDVMYNAILFFSYIIILRLLGSEGYGLYNLVISIPFQVLPLISLSIDTAISRYTRFYLAKDMVETAKSVVKASLYIKMLTGVIATLICFVFAKPLAELIINRPDAYNYVKFASVVALLNNIYTYLLSVFVGFEEVWRNSILKIVYSISRTISVVFLLLIGLHIIGALTSYILSLYLAIVIGFVFLSSSAKHRFTRTVKKSSSSIMSIAREIIVYSLPLHISTLIFTALSVYQTMVLSRVLTNTEIGGYRALLVFQTLITVISAPISIALLPMYTNINARGDRESLVRALSKSNRYIALVLLPLTTIIMVFSKEIVYIVCGADYLFAYGYLPLLMAPNLLAGIGSLAIPQLLNAIGETKLNLYTSIISAILFVPTLYMLTMILGYRLWGFLISSLIVSIVSTVLQNIFVVKLFGKTLEFKSVLPIYASSAIAMIATLVFYIVPLPRPTSVVRVVVGSLTYLLIYVALCAILRTLNKQDVEFFEKAFRGVPILNIIIKFLASIARKIADLWSD